MAEKQRKREEKKSRDDMKRHKRWNKKKEKELENIKAFVNSRKKQKQMNYTYFGKPLEAICEAGATIPVFVDKCIEFVEASGATAAQNSIFLLVDLALEPANRGSVK